MRSGPLAGAGLFAVIFALQFGHLAEHIAVKLRGSALLGAAADSEETHLAFNSAIAVLTFVLVWAYRSNPWVYPLAVISLLHASEHVYIYLQYMRTQTVGGPGLLGVGGLLGIVPLERVDLHNAYNGVEVILMMLGFRFEISEALDSGRALFGEVGPASDNVFRPQQS
jgi:hypothetical protein